MEQLRENILTALGQLKSEQRIRDFSESSKLSGPIVCNLLVTLNHGYNKSMTFYSNKKALYHDVFKDGVSRTDFIIDDFAAVETAHDLISQALVAQDVGYANEKAVIKSLKKAISRFKKRTNLIDVVHASEVDDFVNGIDLYVMGRSPAGQIKNMPVSVKMSLEGVIHRNASGKISGQYVIKHPTLIYDLNKPCTEEALLDIVMRLFSSFDEGELACYSTLLRF